MGIPPLIITDFQDLAKRLIEEKRNMELCELKVCVKLIPSLTLKEMQNGAIP